MERSDGRVRTHHADPRRDLHPIRWPTGFRSSVPEWGKADLKPPLDGLRKMLLRMVGRRLFGTRHDLRHGDADAFRVLPAIRRSPHLGFQLHGTETGRPTDELRHDRMHVPVGGIGLWPGDARMRRVHARAYSDVPTV